MTRRLRVAGLLGAALASGAMLVAGCRDSTAPGNGAAASIAAKDGGGQTAPAGTVLPQPLRVTVFDAAGQPVAGVIVHWAVTAGGGSVAAASSPSDAAGVASVLFTLGPAAGTQRVQASVSGLAGSPVTFTDTASAPLGGGGGVAASMALKDGDGQTGAAGTALAAPLRVTILDAGGQPVAGTAVQWTVLSGGGSLSAPSSVSDAAGVAAVGYTLGPAAGAEQVRAAVTGLAGSPITFTETATPPVGPTPSSLTVAGGGFNVPERFSSDLWVANGYAYTGTWGTRNKAGNAVKIWQLGAGGAPTLVDSIIITGVGTVSDLEVTPDGQTLSVTTESGPNAGLYLYSVATPGSPVFRGKSLQPDGLHTGSISVIGGRTYVFAAKDPGGSVTPKLVIYDITDPTAPTVASQTPEPASYGIHDTYVRDGLAFVFIWDSGFRIYDVGNGMSGGSPTSPHLVGSLVTSTDGLATPTVHNGWWFHNPNTGEKRYLFVGQEGPGSVGSASSGDIHVVDVTNLAAPVEVAYYHMAGAGTHNFWMDEAKQVLYAAYYNGGVVALDVSGTLSGNLASREIARIAPGGSGSTYVWGVQLYNGYLYAIDMLSGLWQLARNGPAL